MAQKAVKISDDLALAMFAIGLATIAAAATHSMFVFCAMGVTHYVGYKRGRSDAPRDKEKP